MIARFLFFFFAGKQLCHRFGASSRDMMKSNHEERDWYRKAKSEPISSILNQDGKTESGMSASKTMAAIRNGWNVRKQIGSTDSNPDNSTQPELDSAESPFGRVCTTIGSAIERLGAFFVLIVTAILSGASIFSTWGPSVFQDQSDESMVPFRLTDEPFSFIVTLLIAAAFIVACIVWCRCRGRGDVRRYMPLIAVIIMIAATTALQVWWISVQLMSSTNYYDAHMLQYLGYSLATGHISEFMSPTLDTPFKDFLIGTKYMMCYPYQSGMVLLWYELYKWFGNDAINMFMLLNVIMNEITLVSIYIIGTAVVRTNRGRVLLAAILGAFLPHILYSGFVYGNQIGLGCACAAAAVSSMAMRQDKAWKTILISLLAFVPAILMYWAKSTFVIILIAVGIVWIIAALRRRNPVAVSGLVMFIAVLAVSGGMKSVPKQAFERKIGYELGDGIPMTSWFEIGLGNDAIMSSDMPGWWFPIAQDNFLNAEGNQEKISKLVSNGIDAELSRMSNDPAYTAWFFTTKIGSEWLNPDFESRFFGGQVNYEIKDDKGTPYDVTDDDVSFFQRRARRYVNYDKTKKIDPNDWFGNATKDEQRRAIEIEHAWDSVDNSFQYMDAYQTMTYALAAFAAASLFASSIVKSKRSDVANDSTFHAALMPACVFAVGFVVYVFWEAKSQYTEPFFMFLIPLVAHGAESIAWLLDDIAENREKKPREEKQQAFEAADGATIPVFPPDSSPALTAGRNDTSGEHDAQDSLKIGWEREASNIDMDFHRLVAYRLQQILTDTGMDGETETDSSSSTIERK